MARVKVPNMIPPLRQYIAKTKPKDSIPREWAQAQTRVNDQADDITHIRGVKKPATVTSNTKDV